MEISIIIPTCDRPRELSLCLQAIQKQSLKPYEVIVVNDGQNKIVEDLGNLRILDTGGHKGQSQAKNLGAREAGGDILVFIDDDCIPSPDWLLKLVKPFKKINVAVVVGRISEQRLQSKKDSFSDIILNLPFYPFYLLSRKRQGGTIYPNGRADANLESKSQGLCHWGGAGNMAVRRIFFERARGFDFNWLSGSAFEEPDLCWRIMKMGGKIFYNGRASVKHHYSDKRLENKKAIYNLRANEVYFGLKNIVSQSFLNFILFFFYQVWQLFLYSLFSFFKKEYSLRARGKLAGFSLYKKVKAGVFSKAPKTIAIDARAIVESGAGKTTYSLEIIKEILRQDSHNHYILYSHKPLSFNQKGIEIRTYYFPGLLWHIIVWLDVRFRVHPDAYFAPTSFIIPALGVKNSVVVVYDLVSFLFPRTHQKKAVYLERMFLKMTLSKVWKIIAISYSTKKDLVKFFKVKPRRVQVVYGAARSKFRKIESQDKSLIRVKNKYHLPSRFILSVGTLEPRKNYIRLIRAFKKLHEGGATSTLYQYELVIVGGKGWYFKSIFQEVKRLNLEGRIHFLGYVDFQDLPFIYNLASVFVFPSLYEGFGLPPLEAMACGLPVIVSSASSLPEVVGKAALFINPKNIQEITRALQRILTDRDFKDRLVRLGQEQVKKFSWEKSAREVLEVLV